MLLFGSFNFFLEMTPYFYSLNGFIYACRNKFQIELCGSAPIVEIYEKFNYFIEIIRPSISKVSQIIYGSLLGQGQSRL
jgi:hypothetical protein